MNVEHNKFVSKLSAVSFESALLKVIESKGNKLVLVAGFISKSYKVSAIYKRIRAALQKNKRLQVEIYIGIFDSEFSTETAIIDMHKKHIPKDFLTIEEAKRVQIYGIRDLHTKCFFMLNSDSKSNTFGVCGLMGSSNISKPTLSPDTRIEFDLLMEGGLSNTLLQSFINEIEKVLENAMKQENIDVNNTIKDRIFSIPYNKMLDYLVELDSKYDDQQGIDEATRQENMLHQGLHD